MKKSFLYIIVILIMLTVPAQRSEIGDLLPVEVVAVSVHENYIKIRTDTGDVGVGENMQEAYKDLKRSAPGQIYLDTADYLILTESNAEVLKELRAYLKSGIRVCTCLEEPDLKEAAEYLAIHRPVYRLRDVGEGTKLSVLTVTEEGFRLV